MKSVTDVRQRKETPPEVIKLLAALSSDKGRHMVSTRVSVPKTDVESHSVREGSITTDDLVCRQYD